MPRDDDRLLQERRAAGRDRLEGVAHADRGRDRLRRHRRPDARNRADGLDGSPIRAADCRDHRLPDDAIRGAEVERYYVCTRTLLFVRLDFKGLPRHIPKKSVGAYCIRSCFVLISVLGGFGYASKEIR